jgi:hypothetical protein
MLHSIRQMTKRSPFWGRFIVLLPPFYIVDLVLQRALLAHSKHWLPALLGISLVSVGSALFFSFIAYAFSRPRPES